MIGKLRGKVIEKEGNSVIIDVNGVGYLVYIMALEFSEFTTGSSVDIWTHQIVREDALDLYGFKSPKNLEFFKLLIAVSGIGPKSALGILSIAPPKTLEKAISTGDTSYLTKVSGIGRKSAEKIILELKDKIGKVSENENDIKNDADVLLALKSLGYGVHEARDAIRTIPEGTTGTEARIKESLKTLSK